MVTESQKWRGRLARWRLGLQKSNYKVRHQPAAIHRAADALSRLHTEESDIPEVDEDSFVLFVDEDI